MKAVHFVCTSCARPEHGPLVQPASSPAPTRGCCVCTKATTALRREFDNAAVALEGRAVCAVMGILEKIR